MSARIGARGYIGTATDTGSCPQVYKAFKQIPFTAKKAKPAKIRKDLWKQMALVQFPTGKGVVGQSVFAKLREFNRRHLLEWDDGLPYEYDEKKDTRRVVTRRERGKKILEQKANAVADLAAVLGGVGKSNKVKAEAQGEGGEGELCEATVYWANGLDRHHAVEWTRNVKHGLLPNGVDWSVEPGELTPSKEYTLLPEEPSAPAKVGA